MACTKNPDCKMIYDYDCDGLGYYVCKGESDALAGSCIYLKGTPNFLIVNRKGFVIKILDIKFPQIISQATFLKF